jgi:hypothetical protein
MDRFARLGMGVQEHGACWVAAAFAVVVSVSALLRHMAAL